MWFWSGVDGLRGLSSIGGCCQGVAAIGLESRARVEEPRLNSITSRGSGLILGLQTPAPGLPVTGRQVWMVQSPGVPLEAKPHGTAVGEIPGALTTGIW